MKKAVIAVVVLLGVLLSWAGTESVLAQPILERLEKSIRNRRETGKKPGKPADTPAKPQPAKEADQPPGEDAGLSADDDSGYLGVIADDKNDRGRGVRVLDVRPNGPAAQAGIKPNDLITGIAGARVRQMSEMADVLGLFPPGDTVTFDILRGEGQQQVKVTLGRRPAGKGGAKQPAAAVPTPAVKPATDVRKPAFPAVKDPAVPAPPNLLEETPLGGPQLAPPPAAERPADEQAEIKELRRRVEQLERRVAELEEALAKTPKK
jgi:membrane-associated protease RseP (regulator of RpoE activity)